VKYPNIYVVWTPPGEADPAWRCRIEMSMRNAVPGHVYIRIDPGDTSAPTFLLPYFYPPPGHIDLHAALDDNSVWSAFWAEWITEGESNPEKGDLFKRIAALRAACRAVDVGQPNDVSPGPARAHFLVLVSVGYGGTVTQVFDDYARLVPDEGSLRIEPPFTQTEIDDDEPGDNALRRQAKAVSQEVEDAGPKVNIARVELPEGVTTQDVMDFLRSMKPRKSKDQIH